MAAVVLEGLSKVYPNGVQALSAVSLTIAPGELVVIVGPSGSGKTTLLRLVAGLETPSAGRIVLDGRDITRRPPRERNVALAFQRPALYPHLSVRDNLAFAERLRGEADSKELADRVAEAARMLELENVLDRRPTELSGGQQQRVALGRAVVRRPAVFLLDEPLSSLDPPLRIGLRRQLHLLQRALFATMVYVTHDQTEALTLGDRVVVLNGGAVQQAASATEVHDRPANRFVASFLGWPPMNFLDGSLEEGHWVSRLGRWSLSPRQRERWTAFPGRELTLGIRPDRVQVRPDARGDFETVWVEAAAAATVLELEREGARLTACLAGRPTWQLGHKATVVLDMDQAHLFDRITGQALGHPLTG